MSIVNVLYKARAVLDIGSNTIRLRIAQPEPQGFKKIHYEHHIARLGEGLQQTGALSQAGQQRAFAVFSKIIQVCHRHGIEVQNIYAVATAAVREASNGVDFVQAVYQQSQLKIHIISGQQEANLALQGAALGLPSSVSKDMLLLDIGGGSTEFTRVKNGAFVDAISLKLGVVRLTEQYMRSDPPSPEDYQAIQQQTSQFLDQLEKFWGNNQQQPTYLVGTAGTVTTLAAIAQNMQVYQADAINGYVLSKADFFLLKQQLCSKNNQQRLQIAALEQGREDVIIAGLAIIETLLNRWDYDHLIAVDAGLLEGLLLSENNPT